MQVEISEKLGKRLLALAQERDCTLEALLDSYVTQDDGKKTSLEQIIQRRGLHHSTELIAIFDFSAKFIYVGPILTQTLGYTLADLEQETFLSLVHPDDLEETTLIYERLHQSETITHFENRYRAQDGSYRHLAWTAHTDGKQRIYTGAKDLTEEKLLEANLKASTKALAENEAYLKGIINSQIDFVCRYLPDTTITFANDAYCQFFELSREEVIGERFIERVPEDMFDIITERINEIRSNPAPDVRILRAFDKDGLPKWIQWADNGILDEMGNVLEIQAVGRDITALKHAEAELQIIFDHIPVMIALVSKDGKFELINKAYEETLGWTLAEIQNLENFIEALYPDPEYRAEALRNISAGNASWKDWKTTTKDGAIKNIAWVNVGLSDGRIIGIGQDISLRQAFEEQRLYAHQLEVELEAEHKIAELKERFTSMVSHEFRTPLAVILSSTDLIKNYFDQLTRDKMVEKLDRISYQVQRMVGLLDDILRISRSNAGKEEFIPSTFAIGAFSHAVIANAKASDENAHEFVLHFHAERTHIVADQHLLEHILDNLISNAIKYSPAHTLVTVTVSTDETGWYFAVQDQGIGIPEGDIERLYDMFHRARNARRFAGGTGLGLAIVKQYVDLHGGEISVETKEGEGSTFVVWIPYHQEVASV